MESWIPVGWLLGRGGRGRLSDVLLVRLPRRLRLLLQSSVRYTRLRPGFWDRDPFLRPPSSELPAAQLPNERPALPPLNRPASRTPWGPGRDRVQSTARRAAA